ncbi:nondiscriminating glutamyl-tRNA synthetase EARS2, mitochondrial-like [Convolutriloba macropyga]|uniref:nondiscriminating glutamyl-tRNA synthetase EARS2, mitochondrial-like n=1 Tax=Convolutriloba macropyga TaxID=536237 RepID=UPI003F526257
MIVLRTVRVSENFLTRLLLTSNVPTRCCCHKRQREPSGATTAETVRTRFAPSPTGIIHLGGLRTALYNYLFAKKNGGSFILRIEDTDRTRLHDRALESIWEALKFVNLIPDEGPLNESMKSEKGHYGPYVQSERLEIYQKYADKLLEEGKAYRCFCSSHRLTMIKHAAYVSRTVPKYDGKCRNMSETELNERLARKEPFTLRLKLPDASESQGLERYEDKVHGSTPGVVEEGDFIIIKSDGFPTYHFANVVDDHLMKITHVLRGAEWLAAVPRHLFLYKQLGFTPPVIHHLPLIANESGQKLSKRDSQTIRVSNFIETGYSPDALLNYLTMTGGGFPSLSGSRDGHSQLMSLHEMCEKFELDSIKHNSAQLDQKKLDYLSRIDLQQKWRTETGQTLIVDELKKHLEDLYLDEARMDDNTLHRMLEHRIRDVKTVKEFVYSLETRFLWAWESPFEISFRKIPKQNKVIDYAIDKISQCEEPLSHANLESMLYPEDCPFVKSKLFTCIRLCLSIHKSGPRVLDMIMMLGKEESIRRLQVTVDTLRATRDQTRRDEREKERREKLQASGNKLN